MTKTSTQWQVLKRWIAIWTHLKTLKSTHAYKYKSYSFKMFPPALLQHIVYFPAIIWLSQTAKETGNDINVFSLLMLFLFLMLPWIEGIFSTIISVDTTVWILGLGLFLTFFNHLPFQATNGHILVNCISARMLTNLSWNQFSRKEQRTRTRKPKRQLTWKVTKLAN